MHSQCRAYTGGDTFSLIGLTIKLEVCDRAIMILISGAEKGIKENPFSGPVYISDSYLLFAHSKQTLASFPMSKSRSPWLYCD